VTESEKRVRIVIPVHGTWSKRAHWCRPDSKLMETIAANASEEIDIYSFNWSGANRVGARLKAGSDLVDHILSRLSFWEKQGYEATCVLIGHSHGGTVALYACKNEQLRSKVNGVLCMSTPFLHFRYSVVASYLAFFLNAVWATLLQICLTISLYLFTGLGSFESFALSFIVTISFFIGYCLYHWRFRNRILEARVRKADELSLPILPQGKLRIFAFSGDEASSALQMVNFWNWLTVRIVAGMLLPFAVLSWYKFSLVVVLWLVCLFISSGALGLTLQVLFWGGGSICIIAIVRASLTLLNGFDLFLLQKDMLVSVEPLPHDGVGTVRLFSLMDEAIDHRSIFSSDLGKTFAKHTFTVLHSKIYDHGPAVDEISAWVTNA
jgi:pimeloyl-ACP methyl ester carboxylesterase